jgi:hypothetical protein
MFIVGILLGITNLKKIRIPKVSVKEFYGKIIFFHKGFMLKNLLADQNKKIYWKNCIILILPISCQCSVFLPVEQKTG